MPHREILTPEDDLFGRVALYNNLINLEQIVECARAISAEIAAGRPRRSLATVLILKGYLSAQAAGAVEAALRKRLAAAQGGEGAAEPAVPTPKPPPMQARAPAGMSQVVVAIEDAPATGQRSPGADEHLRRAIAKLAPGRIYPEMLNYIVRHRLSLIDARQLAAAIGESDEDVIAALNYWRGGDVIKKMGTYPYCYNPTPEEQKEITFFLDSWHNPALHARVLGFILEAEK
jgi:hypothetical protein